MECKKETYVVMGDVTVKISPSEEGCGCVNIQVCCNTPQPPGVTEPPTTEQPMPTPTPTFIPPRNANLNTTKK